MNKMCFNLDSMIMIIVIFRIGSILLLFWQAFLWVNGKENVMFPLEFPLAFGTRLSFWKTSTLPSTRSLQNARGEKACTSPQSITTGTQGSTWMLHTVLNVSTWTWNLEEKHDIVQWRQSSLTFVLSVTLQFLCTLCHTLTIYCNTAAVAQWVRALALQTEGWVFESQSRQT